jgi:hypothetical protein
MKTQKTKIPKGYEIDKEKSTFENIVFKKIKNKLPLSIEDVKGRNWYIETSGKIRNCDSLGKNNLSSEKRCEAFLALMQLVELRDAWNEGWTADWENDDPKYCVIFDENKISLSDLYAFSAVLNFKTRELAQRFSEQFKDLILTAKELI